MCDFISHIAVYPFLQYALIAGLLASIACGIMGTYVTVRRITSIAGAIAHSILGGMGVALYLQREQGWSFLTPLHGATAAAIFSALLIGILTLKFKQREDTILSAVWAMGMAIGIFFISQTHGYAQDLMSYLFGNILMVRKTDLWLMAGLDGLVILITLLFYHPLQAVCFDEEYARIRGIRTTFFYLLLLCLTALTVVLLVQIVGIIMVIALLALPAATASQFTRRLSSTMLFSVLLCMFYTTGGLAVSYGPDYPAGATIILLSGVVYGLAYFAVWIQKKRKAHRAF